VRYLVTQIDRLTQSHLRYPLAPTIECRTPTQAMPTTTRTVTTTEGITSVGATLIKAANTMIAIITMGNIITEDAINTMETKFRNVLIIGSIIQICTEEVKAALIEEMMVGSTIAIDLLEVD
jgi:hypothetical protein